MRYHAKISLAVHRREGKDNALLGNKGANICEMKALDLPVPFEFILTYMTFIENNRLGGKLSDGVINQVLRNYRY